jgi:hypothetical protein
LLIFSQSSDSTKTTVTAAVTVTNNGISLVPAFSLEKPAAIFDLSVKRKKISFEPQLAFGFEQAKPWYFLFWLKYKMIDKPKFNFDIGFHPGFVFSTTNIVTNGVSQEYFTTQRFFVGALIPTYTVNEKLSIGGYYHHAFGYNSNLKNSDFLSLNVNFSSINLGNKYFIKAVPQVYFLKMDDKHGYYVSSEFTLAERDFPLSAITLLNQKIDSEISGDDFLWNISLRYSF